MFFLARLAQELFTPKATPWLQVVAPLFHWCGLHWSMLLRHHAHPPETHCCTVMLQSPFWKNSSMNTLHDGFDLCWDGFWSQKYMFVVHHLVSPKHFKMKNRLNPTKYDLNSWCFLWTRNDFKIVSAKGLCASNLHPEDIGKTAGYPWWVENPISWVFWFWGGRLQTLKALCIFLCGEQ